MLTIAGADDEVVAAEISARSRRHVEADFEHVVIGGAGHFVPEEQPVATTASLISWLARISGGPSYGAGLSEAARTAAETQPPVPRRR